MVLSFELTRACRLETFLYKRQSRQMKHEKLAIARPVPTRS